MKQYPIVCPSCHGSGKLQDNDPVATAAPMDRTCPACKGNGFVTVTETNNQPIYYPYPELSRYNPPQADPTYNPHHKIICKEKDDK